MRASMALLGCLGLLISPAKGEESASLANPVCWSEPRIYHPGGTYGAQLESAAKQVLHVAHVTTSLAEPRTPSPNRSYAFHHSELANPGPPSGSTRVSLLVFKEKSYLLSVEADGVQSLQDPRWVNEKLVFFRLWLSRLGGVDVLVDVEQESIVRMETFADGRIVWEQARESCKATPQLPACEESCPRLK